MPTSDTDPYLQYCARCQGDHVGRIDWKPLTYPIEVQGWTYTHWAPCPTNGEPILMRIEVTPDTVPARLGLFSDDDFSGGAPVSEPL